jgi:hypothetical protein
VRSIKPDWPNDEERAADLAAHVHLAEIFLHAARRRSRLWLPPWDEKDGDCSPPLVSLKGGTTVMKHQTPTAESSPVGTPMATGAIDTETLELLEAWAREDATDDPEKLRTAQKELDEFKRAMNENRAACGERLIYP